MSKLATRYPPGMPCWFDLTVPDVHRARSFYGAMFGWELAETPYQYHLCLLRGHAVGALAEVCPGSAAVWTTYLATDDVAGALTGMVRAGGRIVLRRTAVPTGEVAVASDAAGRVFGLWHSDSLPGSELSDEPGAPCWSAVGSHGGARSGRGLVYLTVVDVEETVAMALAHGGAVVEAPAGRTAVLADPFGSSFAVIAPAPG